MDREISQEEWTRMFLERVRFYSLIYNSADKAQDAARLDMRERHVFVLMGG